MRKLLSFSEIELGLLVLGDVRLRAGPVDRPSRRVVLAHRADCQPARFAAHHDAHLESKMLYLAGRMRSVDRFPFGAIVGMNRKPTNPLRTVAKSRAGREAANLEQTGRDIEFPGPEIPVAVAALCRRDRAGAAFLGAP